MKTLRNIMVCLIISGTVLCVNCHNERVSDMGVISDHAIGDRCLPVFRRRKQNRAQHDLSCLTELFVREGGGRLAEARIYSDVEKEELSLCQHAAVYDDEGVIDFFNYNQLTYAIWTVTEEGMGPVHLAARHGSLRVIQKLYDIAAARGDEYLRRNFWAIDGAGQLPFHYAAAAGQVDALRELNQRTDGDHNLESTAHNGFGVMHLVAMLNPAKHPNIDQIITDIIEMAGEENRLALLNAEANGNNTPLHVAYYKGHGDGSTGDFLKAAGADDTRVNVANQTCYQVVQG